jgi:hypothetical protein
MRFISSVLISGWFPSFQYAHVMHRLSQREVTMWLRNIGR